MLGYFAGYTLSRDLAVVYLIFDRAESCPFDASSVLKIAAAAAVHMVV
jgi:hypothetical protein